MLGVLIMENSVADRYWCVGQMLYPIYSPKCMCCAYVCYLVLASCIRVFASCILKKKILYFGDWKLGHVQDCMSQGFLLAAVDSDRVKE
jgi:hypothetical protein